MKNKKILAEIITVPLCISYLLSMILNNNPKLNIILLVITLVITSLEFTIKNLKEVYIYESKDNFKKVTFAIFNILLLLVMFLKLIYKINALNILFTVGIIILLIYLIYLGITSIIKIAKDKKPLYKYIIRAFLSLISFALILETFIIYIK